MNCNTLHKKIIFFLDGELPEKEMKEMRLHLSECSDCATFAEELRNTLKVIDIHKEHEVNPFFYTRVKARLDKQAFQPVNRSVWVRVLQPAFFSLLLLAGIYTGIKIGQPATRKTTVASNTEKEVVPYLNEMETETIELFLME